MIHIRKMDRSELGRIAELDRSEHVTLGYTYRDGKLEAEQVDWQIPRWFVDDGPHHSVPGQIRDWMPLLEGGGTLWGAYDGDLLVGVAVFRPRLTETMAQLAVLHVSKDYRRKGIATMLTAEVTIVNLVDEAS